MNTIKKIGLTALAGSLVVTSAYAGAMSVSGGASIGMNNNKGGHSGKSFTMGNQLTFSGSGELDNGLDVSLSFVIDQADDSTTGLGNSPFDSHSVSVGSDALGTLKFNGEGGSSAHGAIDTTAAGDIWDNGFGITSPSSSAGGNNMMHYTLPSIADGFGVTASYTPDAANFQSSTAFAVSYTGFENLTLDFGAGENNNTAGSTADATTMKASYVYGSFTGTVSDTSYDSEAASSDTDVMSMKLSYTITDDLSVSYATETHEKEGSTTDQEVESLSLSYTSGGMTVSAAQINADNVGNSTDASADKERWTISASFAF
jgi:outer membrane protein OmpU